MNGRDHSGLFSGLFDRGRVSTGDEAWLQAMLDTEAALARALERAGLAAAGAGAAVTAVARAELFDPGQLGRQATLTGNPVPAIVRALTGLLQVQNARVANADGAGSAGSASGEVVTDGVSQAGGEVGTDGTDGVSQAGGEVGAGGAAEAVHRGATSQDIIDTAVMLMSVRALDAITADL
ncbi:MAG TPA: hypothetical protein VN840_09505, partial [Streptosporangiaceae bacterium]|nr:hypothetical protein [Streptosporangiaceae bacterium]